MTEGVCCLITNYDDIKAMGELSDYAADWKDDDDDYETGIDWCTHSKTMPGLAS